MPEAGTLLAFAGVSLMLLVVPGPTMMYIVARGIHQGRSAALASALGVELGTLLQLLVAVGGLSALLASLPGALTALTWLGAAYLLWLAVAALRDQPEVDEGTGQPAEMRSIFVQGVLVEALNPETALFFLAFLPQFVDATAGSGQIFLLGLIFLLLALCNDALIALLAGALGAHLREHRRFLELRGHICGAVYFSLATLVLAPV